MKNTKRKLTGGSDHYLRHGEYHNVKDLCISCNGNSCHSYVMSEGRKKSEKQVMSVLHTGSAIIASADAFAMMDIPSQKCFPRKYCRKRVSFNKAIEKIFHDEL